VSDQLHTGPTPAPRRPRDLLAPALAALVLVGYLVATPQVPDLAAQIARADVVRRGGETVWWLGWFGGLHLPTYSAITPSVMAALGAPLTGVIATVVSAVVMNQLLRTAPRRAAGLACFLATDLANLLDGRITFAVSMACGLATLLCLRQDARRPRMFGSAALAVLTCLTSPLGGLFLLLVTGTTVLVDRARRRDAITVSSLLATTLLATALMFPGAGQMPFDLQTFVTSVACTVAVLLFCPQQWLRAGTVAYLVLQTAFLLYPSAVGANITRLAWVFALPLLVAFAALPRLRLAAVALLVLLMPGIDLAGQLRTAADPATTPHFYRPLIAELASQQAAHPGRLGERVEVVDTRGHWASVYVARHYSLARGWERQADRALNPMFYGEGRLDATTYRRWLDSLAVGWVAVPHAALDYASTDEARLIARQPSYLHPVWSNPGWTLYRVADAAPLVRPGTVVSSTGDSVTLRVADTRRVDLSIRWSPYLVVTTPGGALAGCVGSEDGWAYLRVPSAGTYRLKADFDGKLRREQPACVAELPVPPVPPVPRVPVTRG
jgi:hypothetical protein